MATRKKNTRRRKRRKSPWNEHEATDLAATAGKMAFARVMQKLGVFGIALVIYVVWQGV